MSRLVPLLIVATIGSQLGCGRLSENNRRGMLLAGGAAAFIGAIITADGLSCDDSPTRAQACEEDREDLAAGVSMMVGGVILGGLAMYLNHRAAQATAPAAP